MVIWLNSAWFWPNFVWLFGLIFFAAIDSDNPLASAKIFGFLSKTTENTNNICLSTMWKVLSMMFLKRLSMVTSLCQEGKLPLLVKGMVFVRYSPLLAVLSPALIQFLLSSSVSFLPCKPC